MEQYTGKLIEIRKETDTVKTFVFELDRKMKFLPGQFVFLYAFIEGMDIKRAYSIASSPSDPNLELTIELVEKGRLTTYLFNNVKVGDTFKIEGPNGKFVFSDDLSEIVLIAGGSGVTPMRSIIRYILSKGLDTKVKLFYSAKTESNIIYCDELKKFSKSGVDIVVTLTRQEWEGPVGRIDIGLVKEHIFKLDNKTYFLCGPVQMVMDMSKGLKEEGVDRSQIKKDVWGA